MEGNNVLVSHSVCPYIIIASRVGSFTTFAETSTKSDGVSASRHFTRISCHLNRVNADLQLVILFILKRK